jgi:hypothetical protein
MRFFIKACAISAIEIEAVDRETDCGFSAASDSVHAPVRRHWLSYPYPVAGAG